MDLSSALLAKGFRRKALHEAKHTAEDDSITFRPPNGIHGEPVTVGHIIDVQ
jgi:hypothetical protein